jgi:two-component system cell cycle sensor histidine kinase/response regulator CckA
MEPRPDNAQLSPESLRSVTHDMRNLLTAVRGHAELALRGISPEDPAREDIAHAVVVTATIFDLIDQIDGVDRSESLVAVSLDPAVSSMRRLLDALLPQNLELIVHTASDGAHVGIAKLRIERIVLNLVLNARDAMADGGTLTVRTDRPSAEFARVIVSDTGPGFSEEALEHLFEIGFSTKRERGGSGHGLAALAPFVRRVGGDIEVDSVAGEGATINVSLPVMEPPAPEAPPAG